MLQSRYTWEAEREDGTVFSEGGDLAGVRRFSLIPAPGSGLPRHDVVGVPMRRRFGRGFVRVMGGGLRGYLHCLVAAHFRIYVRSSDGTALVTPADFELYL